MISNCVGFFNILELSRLNGIRNIFYASSSSVYGDSKKFPVKENFELKPKIFMGLVKKLMKRWLIFIQGIMTLMKIIGLRFFTVFGPWGRPDLVISKLIESFYLEKGILFK